MNRAEQIAFHEDLNRFQAAEVAADLRAERVQQRCDELLHPGKQCYPWTFEHMMEALIEAPEAQQKTMYVCVASAVDFKLQNDHGNHAALVSVRQLVEKYWIEVAAMMAEKEVE